ncbi:hypothetical protein PM082_000311 [Marasmius tenuissimus]|nr:hypothetical protein PM082_000311 [Marasmius tenuissimus]
MDGILPPFSYVASQLMEDVIDHPQASSSLQQTNSKRPSEFSPLAFVYPPPDATSDAPLDEECVALDDIDFQYSDTDPSEALEYSDQNTDDQGQGPPTMQVSPSPTDIPQAASGSQSQLASEVENEATPALKKNPENFEPTPQTWAVGRLFNKPTVLHKLSAMHIYGGLGNLTLLSWALHLCHVLAVASERKMLERLMEAIGEEVINIHSSLNFWILASHVHWAVDTGLIKIVPDGPIMDAMETYLKNLQQLRKQYEERTITLEQYHRAINEELKPRRIATNYPYKVVGVLCADDFRISRHLIQGDVAEPDTQTLDDEGPYKFQVQIKPFETPLKRLEEEPQKSSPAETFKHQKRYQKVTIDPDVPPRIINPVKYVETEIFWLSQDPFFVLINVGEFLSTLRTRFLDRYPKESFSIHKFVSDEDHAELLEQALRIYDRISSKNAPKAPPKLGEEREEREERPIGRSGRSRFTRTELETPSRPAGSRTGTRSRAGTRTGNHEESERSQGARKRKAPEDDGDGASTSRRRPSPRRSKRNKEAPENGLYVQPPGRRL